MAEEHTHDLETCPCAACVQNRKSLGALDTFMRALDRNFGPAVRPEEGSDGG